MDMIRNINIVMALATMAFALALQPSVNAKEGNAKILETGTFHGKVHSTRGGNYLLRAQRKVGSSANQLQNLEWA